jgi:hypothetical protein
MEKIICAPAVGPHRSVVTTTPRADRLIAECNSSNREPFASPLRARRFPLISLEIGSRLFA